MKFQYLLCLLLIYVTSNIAKSNRNNVIDNIADIKDFKKLIRTKTNVLVCFTNSQKRSANVIKIFREVADSIKGQGTMVLVDCSGDAKKMCKKLKVNPDPTILKHYKDGDFNKDYDRRESVSSMLNFMRDPTGDIPWEEDSSATDVIHVPDASSLAKLIRKETKPLMVMFYAPWCGFCKTLKPEYAAAAKEIRGHSVLAAIDVNRPENTQVRMNYNITGFPTLLYFSNGALKFQYEGENNKNALVSFMRNPQPKPPPVKEPEWMDVDSEVVHLAANNFDPVIKEEASVLVMFYAPWCGHCKKMKPEYEKAAAMLKNSGVNGMLAAVDATKEPNLASRFSVKGYPTVKYFSYGEHKFDVNIREAEKIVDFMKDPKEPPPPPPPEKPWSEENTEVVHLNEEAYKPFLKKKKHVLVMFYAPWCGHCKKAKPEFARAAEEFKDDPKVEFAAVDCTTQQSLCNFNEITGYPTIKYFNYYKTSKLYSGGRTAEDFVYYMRNPDGAADKKKDRGEIKSASKKIHPDIVVLTDGTFTTQIYSRDPTLVMFYAPWCKYCIVMMDAFAEAVEKLKSSKIKGTLAVVDCTKNTDIADEQQIIAFPTIRLFVKGKVIKDYDGDRTPDAVVNFLKENGRLKDEL